MVDTKDSEVRMRSEFVKWLCSPAGENGLSVGDILLGNGDDAWFVWQACATLSAETIAAKDKRIAELEAQISALRNFAEFAKDYQTDLRLPSMAIYVLSATEQTAKESKS
jgi:hypothetical protein